MLHTIYSSFEVTNGKSRFHNEQFKKKRRKYGFLKYYDILGMGWPTCLLGVKTLLYFVGLKYPSTYQKLKRLIFSEFFNQLVLVDILHEII